MTGVLAPPLAGAWKRVCADHAALLLAYEGRINRIMFWRGILTAGALLIVLSYPVAGHLQPVLAALVSSAASRTIMTTIGVLIGVLGAYMQFALMVKRMHDRDKSGWWVLGGFVPIVGLLWLVIELGFRTGSSGHNRFGPPQSGR